MSNTFHKAIGMKTVTTLGSDTVSGNIDDFHADGAIVLVNSRHFKS
jgi:hypothetical protein